MESNQRYLFEEWLRDQCAEIPILTVSATDDRYLSPDASRMWQAWQAARNNRHGAGDAEDAARYRWLRDTRTSYGVSAQYDDAGEPTIWLRFSGYGRNAEDTDAAIDAARAGERG